METQTSLIKKACAIVKSQANLARIIGASPSVVNQWVKGVRPVPVDYHLSIEKATEGAITRKSLYPNGWERIWPELAKQPRKARATQASA